MKKILRLVVVAGLLYSCKDEKKQPKMLQKNNAIEIPQAVKTLMDAVNKDSNNIELQMQLITSLDSTGLYKQALNYIDKLITTDSLNNSFWLKRGQICKQAEDTAAAIKSFKYAAKIYPTPIAMMELANLYAETKNIATLSICDQLMKMNPGGNYNAQAYFFLGVYFSKIGDKKTAFNNFNKSIAQDFHFVDAYLEKGYLFYSDKNFNEALKTFQQLTAINQTNADGYYWQAKCNEAMHNKNESINLYEKALLLNPNIQEAKDALIRLKSY
jgi:tetratricopeptide (TPR) repeat protein